MPTPAPKPGWKTTEFWKATAVEVVGALVMLNLVNQEEQVDVTNNVKIVVEGVFAVFALLTPLLSYMQSRTKLKSG